MKLKLDAKIDIDMRAHARETYPHECCGLLLGEIPEDFGASDQSLVTDESRRLDNTWETETKSRRYKIESDIFLKLEREFAGTRRGVLGIYHSHPNHAAWPSPFDLDHAWPSYAYVIVSVREGADKDARVWLLSEDRNSFIEGELLCP